MKHPTRSFRAILYGAASAIALALPAVALAQAAGAAELLRVANAMYRSRAPASLLPRIDTLLKQPVSSAETRNGRNG